MKLRIKGNSVRYRLTKTDVKNLCSEGYLHDKTSFGKNSFEYALQSKSDIENLSADFSDNKITVSIPQSFLQNWEANDTIGFDSKMKINENDELSILIEKDFQCLDETEEDQSDNFENPSNACNPDQ